MKPFTHFKYVLVLTTLLMAWMPSARMMAVDAVAATPYQEAFYDDLEGEKNELLREVAELWNTHANLSNELKQKATAEEAPELYQRLKNLANWISMIEYIVENNITTMEDVQECWQSCKLREVELAELEKDIKAFQPATSDIAIDATNFPDENFRNWLLTQSYGQDGKLTEEEIAGVTEIVIYNKGISDLTGIKLFTALKGLYCSDNQLISLDLSGCAMLENLSCANDQLTSLNVSGCPVLANLWCPINPLTTLDVSGCSALTLLDCHDCQLSSLNLTGCSALTILECGGNELTSLDVSGFTALTKLHCYANQLSSLNISGCTALIKLEIHGNNIKGEVMDALVSSLPIVEAGEFYVLGTDDGNECTPAQVSIAKAKGWTLYQENAGGSSWWVEMEGEESAEVIPDEAIDLGLPSGTKWAPWNVGASKPEEYGGYYAWGETEEKEVYDWSSYIHCDGTEETCHDIGTDIAGTDYDVAHVKWGESWTMPTLEQVKELLDNCTSEWTTVNGINGRKFTSRINDNSIFLPAAGYCSGPDRAEGEIGDYRSSSLNESNPSIAHGINFYSDKAYEWGFFRYYGLSVRPVISGEPSSTDIAIDATNFPDENFRNWLLEQDYGQDGKLTEEEIGGITRIEVFGYGIKDLTGIGVFTALAELYCSSNQLTSLDVSKNTALQILCCHYNQLTALDVSNNTALTYLDCGYNQQTSLDVSKNTALETLYCNNNQLTALDVSKNTALTALDCSSNQLTSLDVSKNTAVVNLYCNSNQLTALDVSNNTALTRLFCSLNQLTSLDVSKNTAVVDLYCNSNQLTALDVSNNTALTALDCSSNQLTSLDVSNNTALTVLHCYLNNFDEAAMDALVASLPNVENSDFFVKYPEDSGERNVITSSQVAAANAKGWKVLQYNGSEWVEMEGEEPAEVIPDEAIDLGLPSGTKWAPWNVGASKPEEYGGYYAWGETEEKEVYDWSTYIHCDGTGETCHDIGTNIAGTKYDVAHVKWGGSWTMPTLNQVQELLDNCSSEWTTVNGINGRKFTGPNGNSIFIPAAGYRWHPSLIFVGSRGIYWSSSLSESSPSNAYNLLFDSSSAECSNGHSRETGRSVRPVSGGSNIPDTINDIPSSRHSTIYNLSGQRLTKPQRGVNIIDGKKVIVK